jgi:hypothetical protein
MPVRSSKLKSSWLADATYDDLTQTMTVTTASGTKHEHQVPRQVYEEFMNAPSHGQYYNAKLRK